MTNSQFIRIHNLLVQGDFLELETFYKRQIGKKDINILLMDLPQNVILKPEKAKITRANLIKYQVISSQLAMIKFLKFIRATFGEETLLTIDKAGRNFIDYAVTKNYLQILQQFYFGDKVNPITGQDYIMQAVKFDSYHCVQWLLEKGETIWRTNKYGQSALKLATLNQAINSEQILRNYSNKHQKLHLLYLAYSGNHQKKSQGWWTVVGSLNESDLFDLFRYIV